MIWISKYWHRNYILTLQSLILLPLLCRQIAQLKRCEPISEQQGKDLCLKAREILIEEGNVQYVDSPETVSISKQIKVDL